MTKTITKTRINKKPTPKQIAAAKAYIENLYSARPEDLRVILGNIGYSPSVMDNPQLVTESDGFKQAIRDMGLTEHLITTSLVQDIKKKPSKRIHELKLGAEILGMTKKEEEKGDKKLTIININYGNNTAAQIQPEVLPVTDIPSDR